MEEQKRTNKEVLAKGIKTLAGSLGAIVAGPVLVYNAFMNQEHPLFYLVLSIGIIIMILAIILLLIGINTILKSFFD